VAATFRDCFHSLYKSSTKNKVAKRRAARKEVLHQQPNIDETSQPIVAVEQDVIPTSRSSISNAGIITVQPLPQRLCHNELDSQDLLQESFGQIDFTLFDAGATIISLEEEVDSDNGCEPFKLCVCQLDS
jgi:hypothetical protein